MEQISIFYKYTLLVCLVGYLYPKKERQTAEPIQVQFFCGTLHGAREGLWMLRKVVSKSFACLSFRLFVCLYPINVKSAELIRTKFLVGPHMTKRKVLNAQIFLNFTIYNSNIEG